MQAKPGVSGSVTASQASNTATFIGLTVGEIAEALKNIEPDSAALIERIRGWTKQRFLTSPSNLAAGTGKHLKYDPISKFEVAFLNALAADGWHVAGRPYIQFALARLRTELPKWQRRAQKSGKIVPLYAVISRPMNKVGALNSTADIVSKITFNPTVETTHIVNLGQLFSRVR